MYAPSPPAGIDALADLLRGRRVTVLTGAGISTESGIPDYRSPRPGPRPAPMQHDTFVRDADARRRYWARSAAGYPRVAKAQPNAAHYALAEMEEAGFVAGIITQNVDGLHQRAGSRRVVELHGALRRVRCLACGDVVSRDDVQDRLARLNPEHPLEAAIRPDGDAALADALVERFEVPGCACGGVWMPDVVFFGGSVPRPTVADAWALYEDGDVLLVVGSSLAVYSGFRFVVRAAKEGRPTGLLTLGPTRADDRVDIKVSAPLGAALPRLAAMLTEAA
ncbi:MAG TPA: NAD-dependent protein deacetylase [Bacteroidetes bacterium]|nr:NAD-dependent protein deacetylase [Bacteroidota bacterium]HIL58133.1 NAD-dependent protein deacetylase [Rhodothermales bacterium]